jgi:hypothetical protein
MVHFLSVVIEAGGPAPWTQNRLSPAAACAARRQMSFPLVSRHVPTGIGWSSSL